MNILLIYYDTFATMVNNTESKFKASLFSLANTQNPKQNKTS